MTPTTTLDLLKELWREGCPHNCDLSCSYFARLRRRIIKAAGNTRALAIIAALERSSLDKGPHR